MVDFLPCLLPDKEKNRLSIAGNTLMHKSGLQLSYKCASPLHFVCCNCHINLKSKHVSMPNVQHLQRKITWRLCTFVSNEISWLRISSPCSSQITWGTDSPGVCTHHIVHTVRGVHSSGARPQSLCLASPSLDSLVGLDVSSSLLHGRESVWVHVVHAGITWCCWIGSKRVNIIRCWIWRVIVTAHALFPITN